MCMCVCVCPCVCRLLQLINNKRSPSKSFVYRLLVMFSWIALHFVDFKIMLRSPVIARLPTWNAIVAFSEQCVAKLLCGVLLINLVVSSALKR